MQDLRDRLDKLEHVDSRSSLASAVAGNVLDGSSSHESSVGDKGRRSDESKSIGVLKVEVPEPFDFVQAS